MTDAPALFDGGGRGFACHGSVGGRLLPFAGEHAKIVTPCQLDSSNASSQHRRVPRQEARRRIVEATARLLGERRFRELSVEIVMREAGLPRTVFYRYFDGLPHVVITLLDELLEQIVDERVAAGRPGDPEVLRAGLKRTVETFDQHGPLIRGLLEAAAVDAEVEEAYHAVLERSVDAIAERIAEGITEGGLRQVSPRDVARALALINGHYLLDALGREPKTDPAVALETLWTVWTGTLGMSVPGPAPRRRPAGRRSTSPRAPRKDKTP